MSDLSDELLEPAAALDRGARRLARQLRLGRADGDLGGSRLLILGLLQRDGPQPPARIAAQLRVRPQSLTRLLAGLAEEGLIERRGDPSDRRQSLLVLTARGGTALADSLAARHRRLAAALATLSPAEQRLLGIAGDLIERVAEALAARDGEEPRDAGA
ncbi:DNA-binding transcriptional regulator, MarR family [Tistlia consotensis]|uniref:DNA-binding transcriptional regulator, MarR family n=1 Tax=Tistlia consotensis USBA 355 TaxID=560819 RepID=A0A1Y6CLQ3_9PROT|nr:MarR family transcriptional regulator [Tistlia consotensis]SMF71858.1 DNA-binding transcriptional regulator, MarR family [Tistlia consotensis USBA 355]SNS06098.1 DNA-binding transcriptional regulator, MarR family [Tistlia consotensis]